MTTGASTLTDAARTARVQKTLSKQIKYKGAFYTRQQLIDTLLAKGAVIKVKHGKRRLYVSDNAFLDEGEITKIGMDYAEGYKP